MNAPSLRWFALSERLDSISERKDALPEPYIEQKDISNKVVILVDRSESMRAVSLEEMINDLYKSLSKYNEIKMIEFARTPIVEGLLDKDMLSCTNIESALFSAMNSIKSNGRIILISDMLETQGQMERAIREISRLNIALDVIVPDYTLKQEVILSKVAVPKYLTINQTAFFEVVIESSSDCTAGLEIKNNNSYQIQKKQIELRKGFNQFLIPADTSSHQINTALTIHCEKDTYNSNNKREIIAEVHQKPFVCVIGSELDFEETKSKISLYADINYVQFTQIPDCDLLIIADCDTKTITTETAKQIERRISEGMGLLVLPGPNMLGDNLFGLKHFADILPVKLHQQEIKSSPDGCIVFIVDTSGSMKGARLILAKGIVRSSIERLSNYDKAGIVEFYGNRKWAAPIQSAANRLDLNRAINRLTAGGGTVILPAIEEAYYGMLNVQAASKHIVVITDGGIESGDYMSLLQKIRDDNINVSFVLAGPATHTGFMSEMSLYGGGKFMHAPDRFSIPEIDIKTLSSRNNGVFRRSTHVLEKSDSTVVLEDIVLSHLPSEFQFIPSRAKFSAKTILTTDETPILSSWNIGLGTVAFSSSDLFSEIGTEKLFQNLCRYLYRKPQQMEIKHRVVPEFEIKSCSPDYAIAEKIGQIQPSTPVEKIRTLDLHGICLLVSLICFLTHIVIRRFPKSSLVILLVLSSTSFVQAGYPETMKAGIKLFNSSDPNALKVFINACDQSREQSDKKYALAWALLSSQKIGQSDLVEQKLLSNLNFQNAAMLNVLYALNSDFKSAHSLRQLIETDPEISSQDKQNLDQQLLNIAMVSQDFEFAEKYYEQQNDIAALIKVMVLKGDRDKALQIAATKPDQDHSSYDLFLLCQTLKQLGFKQVALKKANALLSKNDDYFYVATEFLFELYLDLDQKDKALEIVKNVKKSPLLNDKQLYEIGILLERTGEIDQAIEIHKEIYERTNAVDCLMRIAALYENNENFTQSYDLYRSIWQQINESFMLYQITPQLVDTASKSDQLVDLIIELEDKMSIGTASSKEIDLLIDIYTSIQDSFIPIEIVKQYYGDQNIESLKKQYHIYRRCRLYSNCSKVLSRLIELEPQNATEYLQQLAIASVECGHEQDAIYAAEKLHEVSEDVGYEFKAGLLSMLGRHQDAFKAYGKLIENAPDQFELWLLWAQQASQCGPEIKDWAVGQLSLLAEEEMTDDKFMVLADAILNLQAPGDVLASIYEKTINRIETGPDKIYLYRLAIDILSEINPAVSPVDLLLSASCYTSERRLAFIQEAMNSLGDLSSLRLDLARLLVFMDWKCSPNQHIKLGQIFLENGYTKLAEYLFRSNSLLNIENRGLYLIIADIHQRRSDFKSALNILLEAMTLYPEDIEILIETASYYEILGEFPKANELYVRAYKLIPDEISIVKAADTNNKKLTDQFSQFKRIAFEGIVITADDKLPEDIQGIHDQLMASDPIPEKKNSIRNSRVVASSKKNESDIDLQQIDVELEELIHKNVSDNQSYSRIDEIVGMIQDDQAEYLYEDFTDYGMILGNGVFVTYLNATLAHKLGKTTEAEQLIIECYLKNPQNRRLELKTKDILEANKNYRKLADLLVKVAENTRKSPLHWREITRLYYLDGDLEKAKWANSYACGESHFVLGLLDYLFLYTKQQDIEKMKQYFRKYQIDCRKKNKYYALRWNNWDNIGENGKITERDTVYMVLSQYQQLYLEFKRYYRAVYADRRDSRDYEQAFNNYQALN